MNMDRTKPDTSAPDPDHNVSSSMTRSIFTSSMVDVSPSKLNEDSDFVASGPSNCATAVAPHTGLDTNMDTSGTTPNENQEVPSSMGSNEDTLMRVFKLLLNPNMGKSMSDFLATFCRNLFKI